MKNLCNKCSSNMTVTSPVWKRRHHSGLSSCVSAAWGRCGLAPYNSQTQTPSPQGQPVIKTIQENNNDKVWGKSKFRQTCINICILWSNKQRRSALMNEIMRAFPLSRKLRSISSRFCCARFIRSCWAWRPSYNCVSSTRLQTRRWRQKRKI